MYKERIRDWILDRCTSTRFVGKTFGRKTPVSLGGWQRVSIPKLKLETSGTDRFLVLDDGVFGKVVYAPMCNENMI